ncbi:MAG TPA: glycine cleavage T C-terminal barrel domain-containing protein [Bryobacteraceae bacterium]|nr:glycine cleavage T C-terminal barrel domain-containing protein [Bryobacteraceae bacterium]
MEPAAGYRALREGAGWLDLSDRGRIFAAGEDSARLLHAMSTNHIQGLAPGGGCYTFFLNAQGRIQADALILRLEGRFLLDTEAETRESLYRHLTKYIIADDVVLEDASETLTSLALEGPRAGAVLEGLGAPVPVQDYGHASWEGKIVARASSTGAPGFRVYLPAGEKAGLTDAFRRAGAEAASPEDADRVRLEYGRPRYGQDIFDTTLPQETRQMHAVHFQKGCYLGQEIVERIRSRGHVNKLLVSLEVEGGQTPAPGTKLHAAGNEAGEITSAIISPTLGKVVALGYVRAPYAAKGTELETETGAARVR